MTADRDEHVYQAKLAEQAERYDEMVAAMKKVAEMNVELSVEERNLLSVAYKNVIGARRASWRIISSIEQKEGDKDDSKKLLIQDYKETIENNLDATCNEILTLLTDFIIPSVKGQNGENQLVFYLKMKGDYYRYLSEFTAGENRKNMASYSLTSYKEASNIAATGLAATDPIRLGLALNFSVFYYEILDKPDHACRLAKLAYEDAITELPNVESDQYKDATLILQLLKENLTLWTADLNEQNDEDGVMVQDIDDQ